MNIVILLGNIATDLQLKQTSSGINYCQFNLAVKRPTQDGTADFISCTAWKTTAENICKYFNKGSKIAIEGSINVSSFTDTNNQKRISTSVLINKFYFVESKQQQSNTDNVSPQTFNHNQITPNYNNQTNQSNEYDNYPFNPELNF